MVSRRRNCQCGKGGRGDERLPQEVSSAKRGGGLYGVAPAQVPLQVFQEGLLQIRLKKRDRDRLQGRAGYRSSHGFAVIAGNQQDRKGKSKTLVLKVSGNFSRDAVLSRELGQGKTY